MGEDKATLQRDGMSLLNRTIATLAVITDEILVVGRTTGTTHSDVIFLPDHVPAAGPLGGLYTGLRATTRPWAVAVACDHPFLSSTLLSALIESAEGFDAVVPGAGGHVHPLHAVYARTILSPIEERIRNGEYSLTSLLDVLRVRWAEETFCRKYDPQLLSLMNVNTPADWAEAQKMSAS